MQLPIFPAGFTEINSRVGVETKDGQVCYVYGHLPVFQHEDSDVRSFRMFTSQMIVTGSVKPKEIVERLLSIMLCLTSSVSPRIQSGFETWH